TPPVGGGPCRRGADPSRAVRPLRTARHPVPPPRGWIGRRPPLVGGPQWWPRGVPSLLRRRARPAGARARRSAGVRLPPCPHSGSARAVHRGGTARSGRPARRGGGDPPEEPGGRRGVPVRRGAGRTPGIVAPVSLCLQERTRNVEGRAPSGEPARPRLSRFPGLGVHRRPGALPG